MNNKKLQMSVVVKLLTLFSFSLFFQACGKERQKIVIDYKTRCITLLDTERYIDSVVVWNWCDKKYYFQAKCKLDSKYKYVCLDSLTTQWEYITYNTIQELIECDTLSNLSIGVYLKEKDNIPSTKYYNFENLYQPCHTKNDTIRSKGVY